MKNLTHTIVRMGSTGLLAAGLALSLAGCNGTTSKSTAAASEAELSVVEEVEDTSAKDSEASMAPDASAESTAASTTTANLNTSGAIDTTDLFTDRDLAQTADTSEATAITLSSGQDVTIDKEGVYVLSGEASDVTITVEVDDTEKVQLVLDGVSITNEDAPAVYVKNADKVFVTTIEGSTNTLQVTGTFVADGETNTDAVIFSRDDLVLNGQGTLKISSTGNGVTSKDDLKVTGGSYVIDASADALEANESIAIADGSFSITTQKDALHAENDEDDTTGYVYICGGSFDISAGDDGIQAITYLQIDDGGLSINAGEALEATYVQVNGGTIDINASDDGINASYKSQNIGTPTLEVTGGNLTINMGSGDTDALDSNGDLIVSGGAIDITAQFAFDYDGTASFTGGTITVNGEQISEISNSMMMGGGMGPGQGEMGQQQDGMGYGHGGPRQDGMGPGSQGDFGQGATTTQQQISDTTVSS